MILADQIVWVKKDTTTLLFAHVHYHRHQPVSCGTRVSLSLHVQT